MDKSTRRPTYEEALAPILPATHSYTYEDAVAAGVYVDEHFGGDVDRALAALDTIEDEAIRNVLLIFQENRALFRKSFLFQDDVGADGSIPAPRCPKNARITKPRRAAKRSRKKPKHYT